MRRILLIALLVAMVPVTGGLGRAAPPPAGPMQYVAVDDGTEIAVRLCYPDGYVEGTKYPALVQIDGYGGAASLNSNCYAGMHDYVSVAISLRGTGCSGGQLSLFGDRSSQDGAWIIDNWIPSQGWSNGKVGIIGHSYGGLTGFLVASFATTEHLKAVAVSGLIDDFYRGIVYPGGVLNYGFPLLWGAGLRPFAEHMANASFIASDSHCAANYAQHQGSDAAPTPDLLLGTYGSPFTRDPVTGADAWGITHSLLAHEKNIKAPMELGQQYQDEQTGPRGGHVLWENIPAGVPKRIVISTGRHNPSASVGTKMDWLDCWILKDGQDCGDATDPAKRVMLYFESEGNDRLAPYFASDWPLPGTDWERYKLCAGGTLVERSAATTACDGEVSYASTGAGRHMTGDLGQAVSNPAPLAPYGFTTGLPDTARYTLDFSQDTALAGPLELSLWAKLSSPDGNFWAEVLDLDTSTGATTFVQRGLLRGAANGGFDESRSQKTPGGEIYRPYYSYAGLTPIVPESPTKFEIEIFPLGHVWRAGHQLVLQLHAPPANDPISTYAYEPTTPGVVTILQDADHPTTLLLPFMPTLPPHRATAPACGAVNGEVCVTPALG
ncbi:MAG: CocE/NonD family hydrolase [Acidobacteria bacterium]|nr:CocE/NonD family hydrolase [Acidobacteriota bacterium]